MNTMNRTQQLSARDRTIIEYVGQFRQLTAGQLRTLVFAERASPTPCDRALKRLVERACLARLARLVGGDRGGSAQYVYQLGRAGWKLLGRHGDYWAPRAVNLHALAVADCAVALRKAERAKALVLNDFVTEPQCHRQVGDVLLTPDAYVELVHRGQTLTSWLEVDRGTEHLDKIQDKCERYWKAFTSGQWEGVFPYVLFVVSDERRAFAIQRVFRAGPAGAQRLFSVCTAREFPKIN